MCMAKLPILFDFLGRWAKVKKNWESEKNWKARHRHKVGLARAGLGGLSTDLVKQGRAWLGPARPFLVLPRRLESEKELAK